jgi:hypothetical protein
MEAKTVKTIEALLTQHGLEPKDGDLDLFADILDTYIASLKSLHAVDLAGEEIAPTFNPKSK